jgi:hypothetical protein
MSMDDRDWLEIEAVFAAILRKAREGLVKCNQPEERHAINAAFFVLLAAASGLPDVARQTGEEAAIPMLERLGDDIFGLVEQIFEGHRVDIPPAFRKAFEEEQDDPGA